MARRKVELEIVCTYCPLFEFSGNFNNNFSCTIKHICFYVKKEHLGTEFLER